MTDPGDFNGKIVAEFRASVGEAGGRFEGASLLLLHHTGARTGTQRVNVRARVTGSAERDVIDERQKERAPRFAGCETRAAERRQIPVVVPDPVN